MNLKNRKVLTKEQEEEIINTLINKQPLQDNYEISSWVSKYDDGDLILDVDYQRNYICDIKQSSKFIESILIGCIIPEIQLYLNKDDKHEVIDGKQRLTSIIKFMKNEYELTGLEEVEELNGYKYKDLSKDIQKKLKFYKLNTRVTSNVEEDYKYKIFLRLNKGSQNLKPQEIRNCIFRGTLLSKIKLISNYDICKEIMPIDNLRMDRDEMVLKLIALGRFYNKKWSSAQKCLLEFLKDYKDCDEYMLKEFEKVFVENLYKIKEIFPSNIYYTTYFLHGKEHKKFNQSIFEGIYLSILNYDKDILLKCSSKLSESITNAICTDEIIKDSIYNGTNTRKNIVARVNVINDSILKVLSL